MVDGLCVVLVVGEVFGDIFGFGLMQVLWVWYLDIEFMGVGGLCMEVEGLFSYFFMECLLVMGLVEVLGRLLELL